MDEEITKTAEVMHTAVECVVCGGRHVPVKTPLAVLIPCPEMPDNVWLDLSNVRAFVRTDTGRE